MTPPPAVSDERKETWAELDASRRYRYALGRRWAEGDPVLWVMLNPSTADEDEDDPTIRRCIGYAKAWGYGALTVCNLFALRSTDPKALWSNGAPIGPENMERLARHATEAQLVVAAWGCFTHPRALSQASKVRGMLEKIKPLHYLKLSKQDRPWHPLYLPAELTPTPWVSR